MKSSEQKTSSSSNLHSSKNDSAFFAKKNGEATASGKESAPLTVQTKPSSTPFFANNGGIIQPKLEVHPSDDKYEKEADTMADRVMQHVPAAPPADSSKGSGGGNAVQTMPVSNGISRLQRMRAFESP